MIVRKLLLGVGVLLSTASVSLSNSNNDICQYENRQPSDNYPTNIDDYSDFGVTVKCRTVPKGPFEIGPPGNFHPRRYYNISCERLDLYHQGSGSQRSYEYCESPRGDCITVHKEIMVFKQGDGQKKCWKPHGTIRVEIGCHCRKHK